MNGNYNTSASAIKKIDWQTTTSAKHVTDESVISLLIYIRNKKFFNADPWGAPNCCLFDIKLCSQTTTLP